MKSRKSGFYFTVIEEGMVKPGDRITLEESGDSSYSILDVLNRYARKQG